MSYILYSITADNRLFFGCQTSHTPEDFDDRMPRALKRAMTSASFMAAIAKHPERATYTILECHTDVHKLFKRYMNIRLATPDHLTDHQADDIWEPNKRTPRTPPEVTQAVMDSIRVPQEMSIPWQDLS